MKSGWLRPLLVLWLSALLNQAVLAEGALPFKVAVVDLISLLNGSPQYIEAKRNLEVRFSKLELELNQEKKQIGEMQEAFRREKASLSQEGLLQRERELRTLQRNFNRKLEDIQEQHRFERDRVLQKVQDEIEKAVEAVRERESIDLVLRESDYMFASARINMTSKVLDYLREQFEQAQRKLQQQGQEQDKTNFFGE